PRDPHSFPTRRSSDLFVLHTPWPDFLVFYATPATGAAWVVPKKYIEKVGEDGFKRQPVGLGPYRFVRMLPGVEIVLEANEQYWRDRKSTRLNSSHVSI